MRHGLSTILVLVLAATSGGCRFLSSDEVRSPFFVITVNDVDLSGSSVGRLSGGELHIWAQFVHPDTTFRFLQFTIQGFEGEGTYALQPRSGTFGAILAEDELSRYGYSSGLSEDIVEITDYDSSAGIVSGSVFFYSQALAAFDGIERGGVFYVAGRFRTEL